LSDPVLETVCEYKSSTKACVVFTNLHW
jgi:hypothetical protein